MVRAPREPAEIIFDSSEKRCHRWKLKTASGVILVQSETYKTARGMRKGFQRTLELLAPYVDAMRSNGGG